MPLNRITTDINATQRRRLNENFDVIERDLGTALNNSNSALRDSSDAIRLASAADVKSDSLSDRIDNLIINSGDSNPEVIASRTDTATGNTFNTLGNRLDSERSQINQEISSVQTEINNTLNRIQSLDESKANVSQLEELSETKADLNFVEQGLASKLDSRVVNDLLNEKVDVNGVGQIDYDNLSQRVREMFTGGSVAVVGEDAVSSVNIVNNAVTTNKRTVLGDSAIYQCFDGTAIDFDFTNKVIRVPFDTTITYRNKKYAVTQATTIAMPSTNDYTFFSLYFNTSNNTFSTKLTVELETVTENDVLLAIGSFVRKEVTANGVYAINGIKGLPSTDRTPVGNHSFVQCFNAANNTVNFDFVNRRIVIPRDTSIVWGKNRYTTNVNQDTTINFDANTTLNFYALYFDTLTNSFNLYVSANFANIKESEILLAAIAHNRQAVVTNMPYSINGFSSISHLSHVPKNRINSNSKQAFISCFAEPYYVDFDFIRRQIIIPADTNIIVDAENYTVTSRTVINFETTVAIAMLLYNRVTNVFSVKYVFNANTISNDDVLIAMLNRNTSTVIFNGSYAINGIKAASENKIYDSTYNDVVRVSAHRGYNQNTPENTQPAFIRARSEGFEYVEFDVRFTSDNIPVLIHDSTIDRTARLNGGGAVTGNIQISSITYAQALEYDFGLYAGQQYSGTRILTLDQALTLCKKLNLKPYLHLSLNTVTSEQIQIVYNSVRRFGLKRFTWYVLNTLEIATSLLSLHPNAQIGLAINILNNSVIANVGTFIREHPEASMYLDASFTNFSQELANACHVNEVEFGLFVGNTAASVNTALNWGAVSLTIDNINAFKVARTYI